MMKVVLTIFGFMLFVLFSKKVRKDVFSFGKFKLRTCFQNCSCEAFWHCLFLI